jgi:hypothetical protein
VAVHDPKLIRMDQRLKAWLFSLHGVDLAPITRTIEIGQKPAAYHAGITANRGRRFLRNGSGRGRRLRAVHIVHDWNEEQCVAILSRCRHAIKPDGRLLIVEIVLPAGDTPHLGKVMDMVMLVFPGWQERTKAEYASLLGKSGFRLNRVVPTASAVSVLEAIPV